MKTWEKILLYPIGLYLWLTDGIKKMSKKWKPAMAMMLAVVMLCGMLPATAWAAGSDEVPDGGIGFHWGSSGFVNITMPTTEGYYTYGTAGSWSSEETAANVSALPESGWDWAVQKEASGFRMILGGMYLGVFSSKDGLIYKCDLTLELRNGNTISINSAANGNAAIRGTGDLTIVGEGSLNLSGSCNGLAMDGNDLSITGGNVTISAQERAIVADSVELTPNTSALTSDDAEGHNAQIYIYGSLATAKWFASAYIAPGNSYSVKFSPTDNYHNATGTGTMANAENVAGVYTLPESGYTPPEGMLFTAWKVNGKEMQPGEQILVSSSTWVYAVWEDNPDTFTVSFNRNNGSGSMDAAKDVVGAYVLPASTLTPPPGMMFKAWSVNDTEYAVGDTIQITADTTVKAIWEDDPDTVAVYFDANGGRGSRVSASDNSAAPFQYTLPKNEWPNQIYAPNDTYFAGWLVGDTLMQPGDTITVTEDTIVKAAWEQDDYYLTVGGVHINYQNADEITHTDNISGKVSYDYETKTLTLENATIYSVYMGGTLTTAIYTDAFDFNDTLTIHLIGDNTIYGDLFNGPATSSHRYSIDAKDLAFTGNGSLTVTASETDDAFHYTAISSDNNITVGGDCTITAICKNGSAIGGNLIAEDSTVLASTSITGTPLVAYNKQSRENKYVKIQPAYDVTVSFDANGGSGNMSAVNAVCAQEYTLPECSLTAPAGKQFKAWSVNGSEKAVGDKVIFIEDATVTAIWEDITHTCSIEPVEKVWPDCENGGKEAYYKCDGCGKFFEDANGTTEIANIETWGNLPKNGHTEGTEWKSDGEYHWHICTVADCGAVIDSSKAAHSSTGANVATCQKKAVCDVCGVTYGDFADHDWNTSWEKDETGHWYECNTAECAEKKDFAAHTPDHQGGATEEYAVKCAECLYEIEAQLNHTHVFDKQVADERYKVSGATCTEPAKYYVSCACGEKGADTFENGAANGHTAGTEWKSDADNHWHLCTVAGCGAAVDSSAHTPDRAAATETDPVKCSVCGYEIAPALGHKHAYGAAWKSDADNHWNECVCGEKANAAAHKDENSDGKCDVCEYEVGTPGGSDDDDQPASNPQTSDNNMLWICLGLLCVSAMGIFAVTVFSKKKSVR